MDSSKSVRPRRSERILKDPRRSQESAPPSEVDTVILSSDEESVEHVEIKQDTVTSYTPLAGKEIYGFDRVKKHERVVSTPEKTRNVPKTPHKIRKLVKGRIERNLRDSSTDEDVSQDSESEYEKSESASEDSSPQMLDDSSETTSEDSDSSQEENSKPKKPIQVNRNLAKKSTSKTTNNKYVIRTEEYFSHAAGKSATSNNTLDKLQTPRLNQNQLQKLLSKMSLSELHQLSLQTLSNSTRETFSKWLCLMHENFNILLYGLGSKKSILQEFQEEMLCNDPVIVINGFFPSLTLKDILDAIVSLLGLTESANAHEVLDEVAKEMQFSNHHLYLIVHNIEGDMLRNNKSQNVFARLAAMQNVHLVASIDHINAPLIWDHNKLSKLNFIWFDVTSYLAYTDETSFESSMMVQRTGNLALSSLRNVFLSLTSNSKGIYTIIIKYQLEHNNNQYYQGLLFKDLYVSCREGFLVSSDLALRAQLTEFVDHKMVKLKRSADGAEYLIIPIANNLLQQFLNEQK